ncbi:uncharacterized protein LOC111912075 [Lactuca sativa]|uniref:uncharacterized protein LOC111912075 n=1 Tax=Lactuca sativa TaxID=4236 RepID=UPI000CD88550|nr:uncharacterized protein LOC111912075 [Lactuca sativa]
MSIIQGKENGNGGVPLQYPMLSPTNYTTWAIKMEAIMDAQGVWESIEHRVGAAVDEKKSKKARALIFQALPDDVILQVAQKKTTKEVWDSLKTRYLGADQEKISGISSSYVSLGENLANGVLVRKLLDSVPDKYLQLVASIEQYADVDDMPFEEAIGRLKAYESRLKLRSDNAATEAKCPKPKHTEGNVNLTQAQEDETTLLLTVHGEKTEELVLLNEDKVFPSQNGNEKDTWYLDNGASNHMTGVREYFAELDENIRGQVRFGDGSRVQIKGKGTILLDCKNKEQLVIAEVYYIPALRSNILSLGQMTEEGYKIGMKQEFLKVHDKYSRLVMKV